MCSLLFLKPKGKRFKESKCQMGILLCPGSLQALRWRAEHRQLEGDGGWRRAGLGDNQPPPSLLKDSWLPVNLKAEFSSEALACLLRSRICRRFAFSKWADAAEENGHAFEWQGLSIAEAKTSTGRWMPDSTSPEELRCPAGQPLAALAASYGKVESAHISNSPFLPQKNEVWG